MIEESSILAEDVEFDAISLTHGKWIDYFEYDEHTASVFSFMLQFGFKKDNSKMLRPDQIIDTLKQGEYQYVNSSGKNTGSLNPLEEDHYDHITDWLEDQDAREISMASFVAPVDEKEFNIFFSLAADYRSPEPEELEEPEEFPVMETLEEEDEDEEEGMSGPLKDMLGEIEELCENLEKDLDVKS